MLKSLVQDAIYLPEELEKVLKELGEVKSRLAELEERKKARELEALKQVANGDHKNETQRKAAILAFLASDPEYQEALAGEKYGKAKAAELEAKLEVLRYRMKLTRELIRLAAAAIEGNHKEALESLEMGYVESRVESGQEKQERTESSPQLPDYISIQGTVVEAAMGKKAVKAVIETPHGSRQVVYARHEFAEKLKPGKKVRIKARRLKDKEGEFLAEAIA
ncbi:hypothetical protein DXX99_03550 [Ammonifex thiophilus]|uniref:Uncharacterized protein n=2 Tax=Ammonifex thiophilus TaxID=444093 RepID=A0A3D8P6F9_9THEO|nr:hypothetical protein DXX99_03550 [Ammonifex thiophilus]